MKNGSHFIQSTLLALACVACAGSWAQGNGVKVYGAVDLGMERADNGDMHTMRLSSGLQTVSRLGFMGSEDLGGGWKARFRLEAMLNADDGSTQAKFFSRFSHVGLESGAGALDLGRMYSPTFVVGVASDPFVRNRSSLVQNMFLTQTSATKTAVTPGFLDNSVRYTSPVWNNLWSEAMVTLGEASNNSGKGVGLSLQYRQGPLYLGYGYQALRSGSAAAPATPPVNTVSHVIGARYQWSAFTLYGQLNRNLTPGVPASTNSAVSLSWKVAGPHTLIAQLAHRSVALDQANSTGLLLGYNYALSKRSTVYARYGKVRNERLSGVTLNGFQLTQAGADPSTMSIGLSHLF